jgi:HK97 gp10 family phage protein
MTDFASIAVKNIGKVTKNLTDEAVKSIDATYANVQKTVDLIYSTATTKRERMNYVNISGKRLSVTSSFKKSSGVRSVSNPDASYGVPVDTGNLRNSIKKEVTYSGLRKIIGRVWADEKMAPYAKYVEFGTSKMAARPFMRVALDRNMEKIRKIFS